MMLQNNIMQQQIQTVQHQQRVLFPVKSAVTKPVDFITVLPAVRAARLANFIQLHIYIVHIHKTKEHTKIKKKKQFLKKSAWGILENFNQQ